jgi:hypothetical protein
MVDEAGPERARFASAGISIFRRGEFGVSNLAWRFLSKAFSSRAALGDVIFETEPVAGEAKKRSYLIWRLKEDVDGRYYIGAKMMPDIYEGLEGSVKNYINFDLESAEKLRANLDRCIAELRRLEGNKTSPSQ